LNSVFFTSAEPTINQDLLKLIRYSKKSGYERIAIITNGRMLSYDDLIQRYAKAGLNSVGVSLHGHNKKIHESLTRSPGSFDQTIRGLSNIFDFQKRGGKLNFTIHCTLNKINYPYISQMYDLFMEFEPDSIVFNIFNPKGRAANKFLLMMPSFNEVSKELMRLYTQGKKLFSIVDFPPCTVRDLHSQLGITEDFQLIDKKSVENDNISYWSDAEEGKKYLIKCKSCKMIDSCLGIPTIYIKKFGEEEFNPIK